MGFNIGKFKVGVQQDTKEVWEFWPISFKWGNQIPCSTFFAWHGWQIGAENCHLHETSKSCISGFRDIYGQTIHIGKLKIIFGSLDRPDNKTCSTIKA
jgi:hypothetical protein